MDAFDIAAVCAHPDDAELVMGGTIAREAARGRRVALVDLTRGESRQPRHPRDAGGGGGRGRRGSWAPPTASRSACPTRGSQVVPEHKDPMVAAIRRLRPRVVLLQHWEQRHPDHAAASRIVYDACFLAGLRNYRPDLGPAFRPAKLVYAVTMTEANDLVPTFVVDVTAFWETKLRAIAAFASQFTPAPGETGPLPLDRFKEAVELARPAPRPADRRALRRGLRDARAAGGRRPAGARAGSSI